MIEESIYEAIKNLCDGRVFYKIAPHGTENPYIVYTDVSNPVDDVFCGQSFENPTFQIDVYVYESSFTAKTIRNDVYEVIKQFNPSDVTKSTDYEPDTKLFRATLEFSLIN